MFILNGNGFYCHFIILTLFNSRMKGEFTKDENELCYASVQETVQDSKAKPKMGQLKTIMTRPAFKWTAVVILATLGIITVVVPTALEMTKKGTCYNLIIQHLLLKSRHFIQTDFFLEKCDVSDPRCSFILPFPMLHINLLIIALYLRQLQVQKHIC